MAEKLNFMSARGAGVATLWVGSGIGAAAITIGVLKTVASWAARPAVPPPATTQTIKY